MLKLHTRQIDTTTMKRAKKKEQLREDKTELPPWDGQQWNYWGPSTSLRSTNPRPQFCIGSSCRSRGFRWLNNRMTDIRTDKLIFIVLHDTMAENIYEYILQQL